MTLATAIQQLHDRCAIYTSAQTASRLLDMIGWNSEADLSEKVLLEPCVGEGAILLEGARRLFISMRMRGHALTTATLSARIIGFEIHPGAARTARISLRRALLEADVSWHTASELAEMWISERDFLLELPNQATHIAANPPYVRWAKLPTLLAVQYRHVLPPAATRGDLSVAFLHRMQEWACEEGSIAVLISDRWMFAQYGDEFVRQTKARGWSIDIADERPVDPFVRNVGAYSAIVLLTKDREVVRASEVGERTKAKLLHVSLVQRFGTLSDAGCVVRVGPALGAGRTFIVEASDAVDVEPELLRSFVSKQDLIGGEVRMPGRRVVIPYDQKGELIDPIAWPRFARWACERKDLLASRSQFRSSKNYWRTIDAVPAQWSNEPKLLLPELSNKPTTSLDRTGSIPAHSIYAIWSHEWPIEVLCKVLNAGLLELTALAEAPRLKLGWMRFYKRFIMRTPLPKWSLLSQSEQRGLLAIGFEFDEAFERLFGFRPGHLQFQ